MDIGVAREVGRDEHRVALTPQGARRLVTDGHRVFVQSGAGHDSRYDDREYLESGAEIVYRREEVLRRASVLLGLGVPSLDDLSLLDHGKVVFGFLHLAVAPREIVQGMVERRITAIGFELIEESDGRAPILRIMGELAGQMVIHTAAHLLENESGGRAVLLGTALGIGPATVLILGAGTVGVTAARQASASGAHVVLMDRDLERLRRAEHHLLGRADAFVTDPASLARFASVADVIVGAVRIPGGKAPYLINRKMVASMRPGSVIIDVAIDQGGCIETSRPTTLAHPTFVVDDIVHYCVPNMTANIARTASKALSLAHIPYVSEVARVGAETAVKTSEPVRKGTYLHDGVIRIPELAARIGQ